KLDSYEYLILGYNLAHSGTFSISENEPIVPSAYREPLLPGVFGLGMLIHPRLRSMPREEALPSRNVAHPDVRYLLLVQDLFLLATALLAAAIVWQLTQRVSLSLAALYLVGLSPGLGGYLQHFAVELLVALLMAALSLTLLRAAESGKPS